MTKKISDAQLLQLADVVARYLGLHFPKERWLDLQRGVCGAAKECGCPDLDSYVQGLLSPLTQRHLEALASRLTVGETYFFREKRSLEVLERDIVPELIRARAGSGKAIRIWSAGCATGEEPYSVAIMLSNLMGLKKWNVEILATDLNSKSLLKASQGIYGEWSFRGIPPGVRSTYFETVEEGHWAIAPAIKKMVTFVRLNLIDDAYPPVSHCPNSFDVILCRNVLMYLTPEGMRKVVRQLHRSLATDGWLIVSPTETSQELFPEFATVSFGNVTFYRKSATRVTTTLALPVYDAGRSSVQPPEHIFETLAPTRSLSQQTIHEDSHSETRLQNTAPSAASYEQALALYEQGRYDEVERVIRALLSDDGNDASAVLLLARTYANQGKLPAALVLCDKAIAADKMAAGAYYLRATILQEQGSLPEALLAFKQTVYADPEFMLGHFALGSLALNQRRPKESAKHFANVLLLLARYEPEDIVPESEGLSAGRLREMIILPRSQGTAATQTEASHVLAFRNGSGILNGADGSSMRVEDTMSESLIALAPGVEQKSELDWAELHRRLDASHAALKRRLAPSPEEKSAILHARARLLAGGKAETASPHSLLEVVEFVLGPERYGIELSRLREIHPLSEFTPLPCTPAFVLGLVNVRGQILSIINIKKLFGLPEKGLTDLNKVIIIHANHMEVGILADAIVGVRPIMQEELHPALPTLTGIRAEYLKGITKDPMVVLDVEKILSDEKILVNEAANTES